MRVTLFDECVKFQFNRSPSPFFVHADLVVKMGGVGFAFNVFASLLRQMPRSSSLNHPWTEIDLELGRRNQKFEFKHWRYKERLGPNGQSGYGYLTESGQFQFVDLAFVDGELIETNVGDPV